jgi:hypothetical protein
MPEKPATDPAKPGSKLYQQQALGRRGGIRVADGRNGGHTEQRGPEPREDSVPAPEPIAPPPVKRPSRKGATKEAKSTIAPKGVAVKPKGEAKIEAAKKALKGAEKAARARGRPKGANEPWLAMKISKAEYYRRKKAGKLEP